MLPGSRQRTTVLDNGQADVVALQVGAPTIIFDGAVVTFATFAAKEVDEKYGQLSLFMAQIDEPAEPVPSTAGPRGSVC